VVVKTVEKDGQPVTKYVNPKIEELLGYTPEEWTKNPALHHQIIMTKDRVRVNKEINQARQNEAQTVLEYRVKRKDEKIIWIRHIVNFYRDSGTEKLYSIELLRDISQEKAMAKKMEKMAVTDPLTKQDNRRSLEVRSGAAWEVARRSGKPLSILLFDIDKFKRINDKFGLVEGDKRLKAIAKLIKRQLRRRVEVLGRYGGEEFAVLLPDTDQDRALMVAENIRRAAEEAGCRVNPKYRLKCRGKSVNCIPGFTVSGGVKTFKIDRHSGPAKLSSIIKAVNKAENQAKKSGRNRVCVAGEN